MISKLIRRLRYLFAHDERGRLLAEEIRAHIDLHADELVRQGMSRAAAEGAARRRFGNITLAREDARAVWIARWAQDLAQDVRYALRGLRRQPGVTAIATLSATLGIGACCTIFSIANFALLRSPAEVRDPDSLVTVVGTVRNETGSALSYPEILDLRQRQGSLASVAAMFPLVPANIGLKSQPERRWGWIVTANYFDLVGVRPHLGRGFAGPEDDQPGAPPAIVLSHDLWRNQFAGDASLVGREISFNGRNVTLIGVAPPGFRGHEVAMVADFWIPLSMLDRVAFPKGGFAVLKDRGNNWMWPVARLRQDTTIDQARADLALLAGELRLQYPDRWKERGFHIERAGQLHVGVRRIFGLFFTLLAAVALLVLVMACSNVANLLLARASSRNQEIATRLAIGAGRGRLIRQLLAESVLLAALGGAGGCVLAWYGAQIIARFELPIQLPIDLTVRLDYRILLFAAVVSVLTGLLFGLAPALQATRGNLASSLKNAPLSPAGLRRFGFRNFLIVFQVGVSAILLIACALFLRSLSSARRMDLGMSARKVLFVNVDPALNGHSPQQTRVFFETLAARVAVVPGVRAVSYTNILPLSLVTASGHFLPDDKRADPHVRPIHVQAVMIGPRYFDTLGIPLLQGQDFGSERPDGEAVVIVNEAFARRAFPGQDPVGRRVYRNSNAYRVIGLAATSKVRTIGEPAEPQVYHAISQMVDQEDMPVGLTLAVRTEGDPALWLPAVKEQVTALDRSLAAFDVKTMDTHLRNALLLPRLAALMFSFGGGMGLLIAVVGLYGIVSFAVARRTKEIGIRIAIGACRHQVLAMILKSGIGLTLMGILIGILAAWPVMRVASSLL